VFDVQRDAALAAIQPNEEAGLTVDKAVVGAREVALTGALDLDDIGAQVGEVARTNWRRHRVLECNDTDAFKWEHD
jgi:hypothetical protein